MSRDAIYDTIKKTIHAYLPGTRVLLFGSHARGNQDSQSDYDLLIITPGLLTRAEKLNWSNRLDQALIDAIHAPVDLLLYSEQEIIEKQALPGHIVRTAMREGISL